MRRRLHHGNDLIRLIVYGDHRRLIDNDATTAHIHERVSCAKVNTMSLEKKEFLKT